VSGLLKAGDRSAQSAVQRLGAVPLALRKPATKTMPQPPEREQEAGPRATDPTPERNAVHNEELDRQCMELEASVAELRHRLKQTEEDAEARIEKALDRGRQEGREEAESSERRRIEALEAALAAIRDEHRVRIGDCELLALQLARTAISRIFGEREDLAERVAATLAYHLAEVKHDLVVGVRVSSADFPDEGALSELARTHGEIVVRQDGDLAAGECEVDLKLGKIDLGLDGQWQRLSAFFDTLAQEDRRE